MTQRALPRSALGKAIAYTSGLWPGLVRFLADPKIPLDTNSVERALRGVAIVRSYCTPCSSMRKQRILVFGWFATRALSACERLPNAVAA